MSAVVITLTATNSISVAGAPDAILVQMTEVLRGPVGLTGPVGPQGPTGAQGVQSISSQILQPIKVASGGDSIANITVYANADLTKATPAMSGTLLTPNKLGTALPLISFGACRVMANCGVSGDTTTGFLARDAAGISASRKAITDAANLGAQVMIVSIGINDIGANVNSSTTAGAITTFLTGTLYPNLAALFARIRSLGMWPVYQSLGGYSYGSYVIGIGGSLADVNARCAVLKTANAYIRDVLLPGVGSYADTFSVVADPATGYYLSGMSADGIHPTIVGARLEAAVLWAAIAAKFGTYPLSPYALPSIGVSGNVFANPTLSASSGGLATGIAAQDNVGTTTKVTTINAINGTTWQEFGITPLTYDATNTATVAINISLSIVGGSPLVAFAAGDLLGCEADVWVDDGAGGVPANFQCLGVRSRMWYAGGASSSYIDTPGFGVAIVDQSPNGSVIRGKAMTLTHAAPDTSANMTTALFTIFAQATAGAFRIRVGNIRAVKLPAGY